MKNLSLNTLTALARWVGALALASCVGASASGQTSIKSFTMTVAGTSSLHDWESNVTEVNATGELALEEGQLRNGEEAFAVQIPVLGIASPHKRMDKLTYEALAAKQHPNITFTLASLKPLEDGKLQAEGELTIAGSSRQVEMEVEATPQDDGAVTVVGSVPLLMTDYGIKPPSLMLGAIKVHDPVTLNFSLTLNVNSHIK